MADTVLFVLDFLSFHLMLIFLKFFRVSFVFKFLDSGYVLLHILTYIGACPVRHRSHMSITMVICVLLNTLDGVSHSNAV